MGNRFPEWVLDVNLGLSMECPFQAIPLPGHPPSRSHPSPLPTRCCRWLEEASTDFRVGSSALGERGVRFAVYGCGNSLYTGNFNTVAKCVGCGG